MYKTDLHVHTAPQSACAHASAEQTAACYADMGYSTVVLTNHVNGATFRLFEEAPWADKARYFLAGYSAALAAGRARGITVLLGMEARFPQHNNDYLIFGMNEEFLLSAGDPREYTLEEYSKLLHQAGMRIYQAHPFRIGMTIVPPEHLDGYEINNTHRNHNSHNAIAAAWAREMGKPGISGSDHHDPDGSIAGGIATDTRIETNEQLLEILKTGAYTLL